MRKTLAAKIYLACGMLTALSVQDSWAGIPVVDGTNLTQTTISAVQQVAAVEKQIEQYQMQLQQYQNMLQNTVAPSAYVWSQVSAVINKVISAQQTLAYYKNQSGSLDAYLSRYANVSYYRSSPCFMSGGCSDQERLTLESAREENSDAVKRVNADVIKTVDAQQETLDSDALDLQQMQSQATSATGQMQALQAANQLAAAQANQLMQIRSMLIAQSAATATSAQVSADRQAQQDAASVQLRAGTYTKSPSRTW